MPVRALEFYAGIGGLHLAFDRSSVDGTVVQAFDWDQTASQVYAANFSAEKSQARIIQKIDISTLTALDLATYNADLWLLSPACQPYTVLNPNAKGALDPRARSFLHLIQTVLPELATTNNHPSYLLIENVAGFESSSTRHILLSTLQSLGYATLELLLTPLQFGIPNSRLRYYLLARPLNRPFSDIPASSISVENVLWRHIPGHATWIDPRSAGTTGGNESAIHRVGEYLDEYGDMTDEHLHDVPDKVLRKWGRLFDIVLPSFRRSCCFTRGYTQLVERAGSILQMNENLDTTETFERFIEASSNNEGQAMEILRPLRLRYFSPSELLRLFDFTPPRTYSSFTWPTGVSTKTKYRLIGNSVNVRVVQELITYLFLSDETSITSRHKDALLESN